MKILVFTNMFPFEGKPFYGSFVKDEVEALRQTGCEVDVLFINGLKNKFNYVLSPLRFLLALRKKSYDIIHAHHSYCGFVALIQSRIPVIWTFHEGEILTTPDIIRKDAPVKRLAYSRRFKRMVARRVNAVISVAGHLKAPLGRQDAFTVPCGIDMNLFSPADRNKVREELGLGAGKFYVLFPSTKSRPEKRYELANAAVELAREKMGDIDLLCLENVEHEKVPLYMNASNVLLLTSSFEASPVTIREALACNVPVVSTDVGDAREILENISGCAIVAAKPDEIAQALVNSLASYPRVEARSAMMEYSLEDTAMKLVRIYRKIIAGRGG